MKYFGIKTPNESVHLPSYIWWIDQSEHDAWMSFFQYPSKENKLNPHRVPLADAIRAYKAIGYKCVELELIEKSEC
jgi:hypothetical protein